MKPNIEPALFIRIWPNKEARGLLYLQNRDIISAIFFNSSKIKRHILLLGRSGLFAEIPINLKWVRLSRVSRLQRVSVFIS